MAYFPHAYQKLLLATNATPFRAGNGTLKAIDLLAAQLGLVNAKTHTLVDIASTTNYAANPVLYLAQGSVHTTDKLGPFHGGYKESVKTKGINARYVSRFYKVAPANPTNHIVTVGDATPKSFNCDTTYRLRLDVKGSPALRYLGHNLYRTLDANTGCCEAGVTPGTFAAVDEAIVFEQWAAQVNTDPILKDFILAEVLYTTGVGTSPVTSTTKPGGWAAAAANTKYAQIRFTGAYVDTTFSNCSFTPMDHVEQEPVYIYPSALDGEGNPCAASPFDVIEVQAAKQGQGLGETLVRELILSKSYEQEYFNTDPRMREVLDDTALSTLTRSARYHTYYILHSVPRSANPSGTMDADQYLVKVVVSAANAQFETWMNGWLALAGTGVQLETLK